MKPIAGNHCPATGVPYFPWVSMHFTNFVPISWLAIQSLHFGSRFVQIGLGHSIDYNRLNEMRCGSFIEQPYGVSDGDRPLIFLIDVSALPALLISHWT